jgi:hypothetical protein
MDLARHKSVSALFSQVLERGESMKVRTTLWSVALGTGAMAALSLSIVGLTAAGAASAATAATPSNVQIHGDLHVAPHVHIPGTQLPRPEFVGNGSDNATLYKSTNWSGYAGVADKGVKTTAISAEFSVPSVNCAASSPGSTGAFTSEWAGIDGFNDASVEQAGVTGECTSTTSAPTYFAWYEMYPDAPVAFTGAINPGDAIVVSASKYKTGDSYLLTLTDVTGKDGFSTTQACPSGATCPAASAEVIMEAPSEVTGVVPLADFGVANFAESQIAVNFKPRANFDGSDSSYGLAQIDMVNGTTGAAESDTGPFYGGSAFSATWISS